MKILKNEMILTLLIIVTIGLLGTSFYYTYLSYQKYMTAQNSTKTSYFIANFESVLGKIEIERMFSTTYLITQRKDDFEKLKDSRVAVDRNIWELDEFIKQHDLFTPYSAQIKDIIKELDLVRKKVDDFNGDYRGILFHAYHDKIFNTFFKMLQGVFAAQKSEAIKSYLSIYEKYTELRENSVQENTLISFMILGSRKMSTKDTEIWEQLIRKDTLPPFYTLADNTVALQLSELLSAEKFNKYSF